MTDTSTIYADYQATTPVDPHVRERMAPFWSESFGNPHSSDHVVGWQAHRAVEDAAASVAALIGADPDEIVFTSGATEANNLALFGVAARTPVQKKSEYWSAQSNTRAFLLHLKPSPTVANSLLKPFPLTGKECSTSRLLKMLSETTSSWRQSWPSTTKSAPFKTCPTFLLYFPRRIFSSTVMPHRLRVQLTCSISYNMQI